MATVTKKMRQVLPLPFDMSTARCGQLYAPNLQQLAADARKYAQQHNIQKAAKDKFKICAVTIDGQIDFCQANGALYVAGAEIDMSRTCQFKARNLDVITKIINTMDTHTAYQIFNESFFVDDQGNHPAAWTMISVADIKAGKYRVAPDAAHAITGSGASLPGLQKHLEHYVAELEKNGRYMLTVWPYHTMLGTLGHCFVPTMAEIDFFHTIARGGYDEFEIKGGLPLSENYSPFELEVPNMVDGRPIGQKNVKILDAILNHDAVFILGQAKSHCVAWAIDSILTHIKAQDPTLAKKIYLVEDCTSPVIVPGVIDFTQQANDAFARFQNEGMNVVQSTTPLEDYLPL